MSSGDRGEGSAVGRYFVDDPSALDGGRLVIRGATARRLSRVMRVRRGDLIEVVHAPTERVYTVRVARVGRAAVEGEIAGSRAVAAPAGPRITVCAALIRPQRFDFMAEKATELGAAAIQPVWTERSVVREAGAQRLARWRRLVTEASEQCGREVRPAVHAPRDLRSVVAEPASGGAVRILASPAEREVRMSDLLGGSAAPAEVYVLVGPEGGLSAEEEELARSHGWRAATLGPLRLRAETASIVAVALAGEAVRGLGRPTPQSACADSPPA